MGEQIATENEAKNNYETSATYLFIYECICVSVRTTLSDCQFQCVILQRHNGSDESHSVYVFLFIVFRWRGHRYSNDFWPSTDTENDRGMRTNL